MLVAFSFKNFGPFREEATLDLRAVASYKEHEYNLAVDPAGRRLLKTAAVYGPNASGKSQLVNAYRCFANLVSGSFRDGTPGVRSALERNYHPFLFSGQGEDVETEFDATYSSEGGEYRYGFRYDNRAVVAEWLYFTSYSTKRTSKILERYETEIELGRSVRGECEKYKSAIPDDVLALSFYSSMVLRTEHFEAASAQIASFLALPVILFGPEALDILEDSLVDDPDGANKAALISFLQSVDVDIRDITYERSKSGIRFYAHHMGADGNDHELPLELESDGTRKLVCLFSFLRRAVQGGLGLIVDELDSQLHPLLLRHIVGMFEEGEAGGQLVYTAHDVTMLDQRYVRRDQVWMTDRNEFGESTLVSLAEFGIRNDLALSTAYLSGVFGAIPEIVRGGEL